MPAALAQEGMAVQPELSVDKPKVKVQVVIVGGGSGGTAVSVEAIEILAGEPSGPY